MFTRFSPASALLRASSLSLALVAGLTLSACGGGGGDGDAPAITPPPAANQGVYEGTTSNGSAPDFQMLVLEDGAVWAIYGNQVGGTFFVDGFVQGQGSFNGGQVSANDIRDHGFLPALSGRLAGSYNSSPAVSGQIAYTTGTVTFSATGIVASTYNYQAPAQLSAITGSWSTSLTTGETASLNISNTGVVGGIASSGCTFTGQVSPRASGKNVFDVRLTFTSAQCALNGQTATGIGLTYPTGGGQQQLIVLVQDGSRSAGVAAFGTR